MVQGMQGIGCAGHMHPRDEGTQELWRTRTVLLGIEIRVRPRGRGRRGYANDSASEQLSPGVDQATPAQAKKGMKG